MHFLVSRTSITWTGHLPTRSEQFATSGLACRVENLGKRYRLGEEGAAHDTLRDLFAARIRSRARSRAARRDLWALRDVSFALREGEVLGVIGPNGAGKSTLLKILSRITTPTTGRAYVKGRVGALLEVGTGFHPELTGRENIHFAGAVLGMATRDIRRRFDEIVAFAQVDTFLDTPFKRYSSGMQMRLAFSVAAHLEPEILIVDEILSIGDAEFQHRCLGKLHEVSSAGRTVLFVSHNMQAVRALCATAIHLRAGSVVDSGPAYDVVGRYLSAAVARTNRETLPADGLGDERARLVGLRILDHLGRSTQLVSSSREFTVEMDVEVAQLHPALCIGFALERVDATTVLWSYQTDGPAAQWPTLRIGRNLLRCRVPGGLLNGGAHAIAPKLSLYFTDWILDAGPLLRFDVDLDHPNSPHWQHVRVGVVAPLLAWSASAAG